jgi:hypothetical protein
VKDATEVLERESLDTEDSRWNKAFGQARAKMGNIQPGPSSALVNLIHFRLPRAYFSSCAGPIASAPHLAHLRSVRSLIRSLRTYSKMLLCACYLGRMNMAHALE